MEAHGQSFGLQPPSCASAACARFCVLPLAFLAALLGVESGELDAGSEAFGTPAVLGVVREQARVERLEAAAARRARALGGEQLAVVGARFEHTHHVAAELDGLAKRRLELRARLGAHRQLGDAPW